MGIPLRRIAGNFLGAADGRCNQGTRLAFPIAHGPRASHALRRHETKRQSKRQHNAKHVLHAQRAPCAGRALRAECILLFGWLFRAQRTLRAENVLHIHSAANLPTQRCASNSHFTILTDSPRIPLAEVPAKGKPALRKQRNSIHKEVFHRGIPIAKHQRMCLRIFLYKFADAAFRYAAAFHFNRRYRAIFALHDEIHF